jgi:hypothetical protein
LDFSEDYGAVEGEASHNFKELIPKLQIKRKLAQKCISLGTAIIRRIDASPKKDVLSAIRDTIANSQEACRASVQLCTLLILAKPPNDQLVEAFEAARRFNMPLSMPFLVRYIDASVASAQMYGLPTFFRSYFVCEQQ